MMVGDPATTHAQEQQEQRAQCVRFCMTMFLLFTTFFIIRVQQDNYGHNHERRRRKHNDPLLAPEAASLDVVYVHRDVPRGLWVRGATGSGPILTSAFIAFLPGQTTQPSRGPEAAAAASGDSSSSPNPAVYFDVFEPLAELRQAAPARGSWVVESNSPWGPKMDVTALAEVGAAGLPSLLAVYRDTRLYRHGMFPGCDSSAGGSSHCLLSFVKLPLSACLSPPGSPAPLSWTCAELLSGSTTGEPVDLSAADERAAASHEEPGCIRLVTGASLLAITSYATAVLKRPYLKSTPQAGSLLQFCGAPLPQLISVDAISGRVFFVQRVDSSASPRRLSKEEEKEQFAVSEPREGNEQQHADTPQATFPLPPSSSSHLLLKESGGRRRDGSVSAVSDNSQEKAPLDEVQTQQSSSFSSFHYPAPPPPSEGARSGLASVCVAYAYLDGFYDDVSRCLPVDTETEGAYVLGDPVFLQVDPLTDALMFAAFDASGQLVLSIHHSLTLKRKFAVKFEGFKSGECTYAALLLPAAAGRGVVVSGDDEAYKNHLEIIDGNLAAAAALQSCY
ncbi:hypothetical protein Efla_006753 [Eimeria flavescens]